MDTHLAIQEMVAFFFGGLVANFQDGIVAKLDRVVTRNTDQVVMMVRRRLINFVVLMAFGQL